QALGVVAVGLAFEVLELPGLAGRVGDQAADTEFGAQVVDPAGQQAGLDDDHGGPLPVQQALPFAACGLEGCEANLATDPVADTGAALVLTEVDGKNGVGGGGLGCRRHRASSVGRWWWGSVVTLRLPHPTTCMDSCGGGDVDGEPLTEAARCATHRCGSYWCWLPAGSSVSS